MTQPPDWMAAVALACVTILAIAYLALNTWERVEAGETAERRGRDSMEIELKYWKLKKPSGYDKGRAFWERH